jgi:hypothetical protein
MRFVDPEPEDIPQPPTVRDAARQFGSPVLSFVSQPSLTELGVSTVGTSLGGGDPRLESLAITFTVWRNPDDRNDPTNLADLTAQERSALDQAASRTLPDWLIERNKLYHYPAAWEAVMTTRKLGEPWQSPQSVLVAHTNHVLMNTFREERVVGSRPGVLDSAVRESHIEPSDVVVDGRAVKGMRIDTDPHVYAVGADLGDRVLTAVTARDFLPYITFQFATYGPPLDETVW